MPPGAAFLRPRGWSWLPWSLSFLMQKLTPLRLWGFGAAKSRLALCSPGRYGVGFREGKACFAPKEPRPRLAAEGPASWVVACKLQADMGEACTERQGRPESRRRHRKWVLDAPSNLL